MPDDNKGSQVLKKAEASTLSYISMRSFASILYYLCLYLSDGNHLFSFLKTGTLLLTFLKTVISFSILFLLSGAAKNNNNKKAKQNL